MYGERCLWIKRSQESKNSSRAKSSQLSISTSYGVFISIHHALVTVWPLHVTVAVPNVKDESCLLGATRAEHRSSKSRAATRGTPPRCDAHFLRFLHCGSDIAFRAASATRESTPWPGRGRRRGYREPKSLMALTAEPT